MAITRNLEERRQSISSLLSPLAQLKLLTSNTWINATSSLLWLEAFFSFLAKVNLPPLCSYPLDSLQTPYNS